jgi:hypothetical protein
MVSDCISAVGPDPLGKASLLPRLEILYLPNRTTLIGDTCVDSLGTLPYVRVLEIRDLNDIVEAIQDILSNGSLDVTSEYGVC